MAQDQKPSEKLRKVDAEPLLGPAQLEQALAEKFIQDHQLVRDEDDKLNLKNLYR